MRKLGGIAVLVAVLAVSGCAAGAESTQAVSTAEAGAQPSAAPIPTTTATGPESTATPDTGSFGMGDYTPDEFFLAMLYSTWPEGRPSDQELFDAAGEACDQLRAGTAKDDVVVIPGDETNNREVRRAAIQVYCPEFS